MSTLFQQITINTKDDFVNFATRYFIDKDKVEVLVNDLMKEIKDIQQPFEVFTDINGMTGLYIYFGKERKNERDFMPARFIDPCKPNDLFENYLPIIHLHLKLKLDKTKKRAIERRLFAHRNLNYLDSSIWHFSAWDAKSLCRAVKQIQKNKDYYSLVVACENANLSRRIFDQSFIHRSNASDNSGDHSSYVVPFVFHSEYVMRQNTYDMVGKIAPIKRRVLFLDDHAFKPMNTINGIKTLTKKDIVVARLTEIAKLYKLELNDLFELHTIEALAEISELNTKKYDIILIDYLLGKKKGTEEREYGYEVLKRITDDNKIKEDNKIKDNKGPIGKYWIMFTSAFTYAVQDRLLAEGFSHSDENWYIGRTACPTTTPELFKFNLLSMMKRQVDYMTEIDEVKDIMNKSDGKGRVISLIDYLYFIFEEPENVRMRALEHFNSLLHLRSRYDRLKRDYYMGGKEEKNAKKNGSPLIQALFPDMDCYSNAFWEHIQHLIYLIAYGNILQWNEMWDEYIFVKENLKSAEIETGVTDIRKKIEKYIIGIKSANFK